MVLSDPVSGLIGGLLIGLASAILLVFNGDIMGFSGILTSSILRTSSKQQHTWKLVYLGTFLLTTQFMMFYPYIKVPDPNVEAYIPIASPIAHVIAGFLVGLGTKMGNGCTSGHGICGLARLSRRSFAAVITFMVTAAATVYIISPVSPIFAPYTTWLRREDGPPEPLRVLGLALTALFLVGSFLLTRYEYTRQRHQQQEEDGLPSHVAAEQVTTPAVMTTTKATTTEDSLLVDKSSTPFQRNGLQADEQFLSSSRNNDHRKLVAAGLSGSLMSVGLGLSQMVAPSKIYGFLDLTGIARGSWDPTLACVMGGGVLVSALGYAAIGYYPNLLCLGRQRTDRTSSTRMSGPLALVKDEAGGKFSIPTNTNLDGKLFGGAAIFGIGWALAGMCPGPAFFLVGASIPIVALLWLPAYIVGALVAQKLVT